MEGKESQLFVSFFSWRSLRRWSFLLLLLLLFSAHDASFNRATAANCYESPFLDRWIWTLDWLGLVQVTGAPYFVYFR